MLDDVNQAPEEFNSDPSSESINETGQGQEPSAETLNAENENRGPIPYERFKEVNDKYQELNTKYPELEKQAQEYESRKQEYANYQKLDEVLNQNPQVLEAFEKALAEINQQGQAGQEIDPYTNQALQAANQALQTSQNIVLSNYKNDLSAFVESEGIPEDLAPVVEILATQAMGRYNKNPLAAYDKVSAQKALADVKKFCDAVYNSRQAQYTKQKQSTETPPNNSGVPPVRKPQYLTPEARAARFAEMA